MSRCNGCGGVIGRDCFNPSECLEIAYDGYLLEFLQWDLLVVEERIKYLEEFIVNNGLEIPYPEVEINNEEDWLPF